MGTPTAALIIVNGALSDGTVASHATTSIGAVATNVAQSSTAQMCQFGFSEDNQATADSGRSSSGSHCVRLIDPTGTGATYLAEATFNSWITDGIRINWGTVPAAAYKITVVLFGGTALQAAVVPSATSPASVGGTTTHTVDFEPEIIIAIKDLNAAREMCSHLRVSNGTDNYCVQVFSDHGTPEGNVRSVFYTDRVWQGLGITSGGPDIATNAMKLVNFTSTGFDAQTVGIAAASSVGCLVLNFGGADFGITNDMTPTATGDEAQTWPGHETGLLIYAAALGVTAGATINTHGISIGATDQRVQSAHGTHDEHNAATTNTGSVTHQKVVELLGGSGSLLIEASWVSGDANGYTLNWGTVSGTARGAWALSVEEQVQTVTPTGIASLEAWGTPTVQPGNLNVSPGSIASAEAWGSPTLQPGNTNVSPSGLASAEAWGTPTVQPGNLNVSPSSIGSAEAWGQPTLQAGNVNVSPSGIASLEAWGSPTLNASIQVLVTAVPSAEAWGTPTLVAGAVAITPTSIDSAEAWGQPTLAFGGATIVPDGIASLEAWGTPTVQAGAVLVSPGSITTQEAWGTPSLQPGAVLVLVSGIASSETWGSPTVLTSGGQVVVPVGIESAEAWGRPFVQGGVIPVTLKKRIHDALCEAAEAGTFIAVTYDSEACELVQGLQVPPASVEANELSATFAVETRHGRKFLQDVTGWEWLLILRFHQEVICEPFQRALLEDPICLPREPGEDRQVHLLMQGATYEHPPRENPSNGTLARYRFRAQLSAR